MFKKDLKIMDESRVTAGKESEANNDINLSNREENLLSINNGSSNDEKEKII